MVDIMYVLVHSLRVQYQINLIRVIYLILFKQTECIKNLRIIVKYKNNDPHFTDDSRKW